MKSDRGNVVLVVFPDSNLRTAKLRPALVVQATNLGTGLSQTIVAMITSNLSRAGHPSRTLVRIGSSEAAGSGLKTDSVVMTDNLATIHDREIDRVIGNFPAMPAIDSALRHTLGL
jgi:mRNA interferase MazF